MRQLLEDRRNEVKLNKLLTGVESIRSDVLDAYHALCPGLRIVNGCGPTEGTISAIQFNHHSGSVAEGRHVPIGTPLANSRVWLMDRR